MNYDARLKDYVPSRRRSLGGLLGIGFTALSSRLFTVKGAYAETLKPTGGSGEGPLYPDRMPLDTDNDLILINDATTPSIGEITHLTGRILDHNGTPLRNAFVEIWQCDSAGVYRHSEHEKEAGDEYDKNFQGYGRFLTDATGTYYFRTIKPVVYAFKGANRTPPIHFAVSKNGTRIFTTEMNIKGHPLNNTDFVFNRRTEAEKKTVLVDFEPIPDSQIGALSCTFDIVLGFTANDIDGNTIKGGIAPSTWNRL